MAISKLSKSISMISGLRLLGTESATNKCDALVSTYRAYINLVSSFVSFYILEKALKRFAIYIFLKIVSYSLVKEFNRLLEIPS